MSDLELSAIGFRVPKLKQLCPWVIIQGLNISVVLQEGFEHVLEDILSHWDWFGIDEDSSNDGFKDVSKDLQGMLV